MNKKFLVIIFFLLISLNMCYAATLTGTIYDSSLNKVSKAIIEISPPIQRFITNNATYYFQVTKGDYNITVSYIDQTKKEVAHEKISIVDAEQDYIYDLFLFFDISEEESLSELPVIDIEPIIKKSYLTEILIISFFMFILVLYLLLKDKKEEEQAKEEKIISQEENDHKKSIINLLKQNNGLLTQKELRKNIPYSEAKISLWITELEHEQKIKKIKKGRGNIIVLKK